MSGIRYLLDEHVDPLFRRELLRREPTLVVLRIGEPSAPSRGTLDPDILHWCEEHSAILLTNNRHTMPKHLNDHLAEERHIPGIFVLNPDMSIGETLEELLLIWAASSPDEYQDRIIYLPLSY
jgi:hypothetical protein